ncbi:MAG: hypothetical protein ACK44S_04915 [Bacteroidota bacterium]|jgi:hypothetical protein
MHNLLYRNKTRSIFMLGLLLVGLLYFVFFDQKDQNMINGITVLGTYLSLLGIVISYFQIKSVKDINEKTKTAIEKSLQRLNQLVVVADLSKAIKIIEEIQQFIQQKNYAIVLIRMKDLKSILIQAKHNEEANKLIEYESFCINLNELIVDIKNMHEFTTGYKKTNLNFSKITNHLEDLSTTLTAFEHKLKNIKNDS